MERNHKGTHGRSAGSLLGYEGLEDLAEPKQQFVKCHQCNLPWVLHRKRYDAEEHDFVRVCSEYPARPVWSVQHCIVP